MTVGIDDVVFRQLVNTNPRAIMLASNEPRILYVNEAFKRITGYDESDVIGEKPSVLSSGLHGPEFYQAMWQRLKEKSRWEGLIWNRRRSGELYPQWLTIYPLDDRDHSRLVGIFMDVSELQALDEQLATLAYYDVLTDLPNRYLFRAYLDSRIEQSRLTRKPFAALFIDLDFFKEVNDLHGHETGDTLLKSAAGRVMEVLREGDIVARLSGDEFAGIVEFEDEAELDRLCETLQLRFQAPFAIDGREHLVTASIGAAIFPDHGNQASELLQKADQAMYAAKSAGKACYRLYDPTWSHRLQHTQRLIEALRQSLQFHRQEFSVVYQPHFKLVTGEVSGLEALIRWDHPELGSVSPAEFIPLAESRGLMGLITECLFELIVRDLDTRPLALPMGLRLGVNISARHIGEDSLRPALFDLVDRLRNCHWELDIEITETNLMDLTRPYLDRLRLLREEGIRLSIDDFGTGYSSLAYLQQLPVDSVKIDRSFISRMEQGRHDIQIVRAILALAQALELEVVAEGIEQATQYRILTHAGCSFGQGFGLAKPVAWSQSLFHGIDPHQPIAQ